MKSLSLVSGRYVLYAYLTGILCSAACESDPGIDDQPTTSRREAKQSRRPKAAPKAGKKRKAADIGQGTDEAEEERVEALELYCLCRQPDDGHSQFIQCNSCDQWYHCDCVSVNLQVGQHDSTVMLCSLCHSQLCLCLLSCCRRF